MFPQPFLLISVSKLNFQDAKEDFSLQNAEEEEAFNLMIQTRVEQMNHLAFYQIE